MKRMARSWRTPVITGLLMGGCFLLGRNAGDAPELAAQGRGAVNPPPPPDPVPGVPDPVMIPLGGAGGAGNAGTDTSPAVVYSEEGGQGAAANGFVAVTGSYGVGTSVLYLIDTVGRQLAVYEARGGSAQQRRIVFVGARKIDLDLQLEGYNDHSEFPYRRLRGLFERRGSGEPEVTTGLEPGQGR